MHEIPVGLEQKAFISIEAFLLLLLEFVKLQMFCHFHTENGLVLQWFVCQTPQLLVCWATSVIDSSLSLQSNPGGRCLRSNLHIQFPSFLFFRLKAGTGIEFQNIEILQETIRPFSTLVRKLWAGREGSKQTAWLKLESWGLCSLGAEHCLNVS